MPMVVIDTVELEQMIEKIFDKKLSTLKHQSVAEPEQILSAAMLSDKFGVTTETISDWNKAGKITGFFMGRRLFFLRSVVMEEIKKISIKRKRKEKAVVSH